MYVKLIYHKNFLSKKPRPKGWVFQDRIKKFSSRVFVFVALLICRRRRRRTGRCSVEVNFFDEIAGFFRAEFALHATVLPFHGERAVVIGMIQGADESGINPLRNRRRITPSAVETQRFKDYIS